MHYSSPGRHDDPSSSGGTVSPRTLDQSRSGSGLAPERSRRASHVAARRAASETLIYSRGDTGYAFNQRPDVYARNHPPAESDKASTFGNTLDLTVAGQYAQKLRTLLPNNTVLLRARRRFRVETHYKLFVEKTWVFEPRCQYLLLWMAISMLATVFTSISSPVEITWFVNPNKWAANNFFLVTNTVITIIFFLDIFVYSNLAYHDSNDRSMLVTSRWRIIKRYAQFWFWIDFCAAFPFELVTQRGSTVLRLLKLLRLGRALRLLTSSDVLRPFEAEHSINYGTLSLTTIFLVLLLLIHLMGCFLFLIARLEGDTAYFLEINEPNISLNSVAEQWLYGMYWAAMTVSTIGYGDVQLTSNAQRAYAVLAMMVGSSAWAYLVGALIQVMIGMDKSENARRQFMSDLTGLSRAVGLPHEDRVRLRNFFSKTDMSREIVLERYHELLRRMSPADCATVVRFMLNDWLTTTWWLRSHDRNFTIKLAFCLQAQSFGPWEVIFRHRDTANVMYFVRDGLVLVLEPMSTFAAGKGFGAEMLLPRRHSYGYSAMSSLLRYTCLWRIERNDFHNLLKEFPPMASRARWAALAIYVRRGYDPRRLVDIVWRGYGHARRHNNNSAGKHGHIRRQGSSGSGSGSERFNVNGGVGAHERKPSKPSAISASDHHPQEQPHRTLQDLLADPRFNGGESPFSMPKHHKGPAAQAAAPDPLLGEEPAERPTLARRGTGIEPPESRGGSGRSGKVSYSNTFSFRNSHLHHMPGGMAEPGAGTDADWTSNLLLVAVPPSPRNASSVSVASNDAPGRSVSMSLPHDSSHSHATEAATTGLSLGSQHRRKQRQQQQQQRANGEAALLRRNLAASSASGEEEDEDEEERSHAEVQVEVQGELERRRRRSSRSSISSGALTGDSRRVKQLASAAAAEAAWEDLPSPDYGDGRGSDVAHDPDDERPSFVLPEPPQAPQTPEAAQTAPAAAAGTRTGLTKFLRKAFMGGRAKADVGTAHADTGGGGAGEEQEEGR